MGLRGGSREASAKFIFLSRGREEGAPELPRLACVVQASGDVSACVNPIRERGASPGSVIASRRGREKQRRCHGTAQAVEVQAQNRELFAAHANLCSCQKKKRLGGLGLI